MAYDKHKISEAIAGALIDLDLQPDVVNDAVFHMTNWLADLGDWHTFCDDPDSLSPGQVEDLLISFPVHVPALVAAAGKLITGFPVGDVFNVGVIQDRP